jgi:uncharacterized membrane protein YkoI
MADAPIAKLNADGEISVCAKGLDLGECGYQPGAKVCGKCGALAQQVKMGYVGSADVPAQPMMKPKRAALDAGLDDDLYEAGDEEDMMDEEDMKMMGAMPKKKKGTGMHMMPDGTMMADEDMKMMHEDDDMVDEGDMYVSRSAPKKKRTPIAMEDAEWDAEDEIDGGADEEEEDAEGNPLQATREQMKKRRLMSMGYKSSEFDKSAFICSYDRKVYPGGTQVCDSCPGGCVSEKGMPSLIEVEGMAEDMFRGKVLDSGYSDEADLFVVDVERKDGKPVEIFFDGSTGEVMGWHMLNNDVMQVKSALENKVMIGFGEAAEIATKSVEGDIVAVEPDVFEGYDVYAVEIEGMNGKSYDVFVSLDGEVLGYDEYTQEEASAIEAEAAEIALKRAYSEETRGSMASKGHALPDGSFPVADENDLRNAVQAFGRAKDPEAAKAHIMKRAVDLGLEELIPGSWTAGSAMPKNGEKSAEDNFVSTLMEFEILAAESELTTEE